MASHAAGDMKGYEDWDDKLGFLTPIMKAGLTELGYEAANHGVQVYGGHGFIKEWGMEQIIRDTQIAKLYEGTTGVQALDLLGRKILLGRMKSFDDFRAVVSEFIKTHKNTKEMKPFIRRLKRAMIAWRLNTFRIAFKARKDRDMVGAASVDYLMYSCYIVMAFFWAKMADAAYTNIAEGKDVGFHKAKIQTAEFYYDRLLPRAKSHSKMMLKDPKSLMQMEEDSFAFL